MSGLRIVLLGSRYSRYTHEVLDALRARDHEPQLLLERSRYAGGSSGFSRAAGSDELVAPRRLLTTSSVHVALMNPALAARWAVRVIGGGHGTRGADAPSGPRRDPDALGLRSIRVPSYHAPSAIRALKDARPDVLVLAPAGEILRRPVLEQARIAVLNGHMGPLPEVRGMNALEWAVLLGHRIEVTAHLVDEGLDTGDVVATRPVLPEPGDTLKSLRSRGVREMAGVLADAVDAYARGEARPRPQRADAGRQYYEMHDRLRAVAEDRLRGLKRGGP